MLDPGRLVLGAILAMLVAAAGYATRTLSAGGAMAAIAVGTLIFGLGGPVWGLLLVAFFATSSVLSEWQRGAKARVVRESAREFAKGNRRDLLQVAANGGLAAGLAVVHALVPEVSVLPAFVGTMAAVTADTWATEIGLLSREPPRLVTTSEPVPPGTSGGVTVLGTSASAAAGIVIGFSAAVLIAMESVVLYRVPDLSGAPYLLLAPVAGLASSAADSWLGATVQGVYRCPRCAVETERRMHHCGTATERVRGWPIMTNDAVNALASAVGAAVAWVLHALVWGG